MKANAEKNTETDEIQTEIFIVIIVLVQGVKLKILTFSRSYCAADPPPPCSCAMKDQKIEVSLIHFAVSIHMAVSIIRFIRMLHYGSPAVQPWSFVSSTAVLSFPHIPAMNNSCSQTERRRPKINTIADRAAFGHRA